MQAFRNRRPWAAGLIGLVFGPVIGQFYLGRGWTGVIYVPLELLAFAAGFMAPSYLPVSEGMAPFLFVLPLRLAGTFHCVLQAGLQSRRRAGRWYSRWHGLIALIVGPALLAFLIRSFLWEPFHQAGGSMIPALYPGDCFLASKFAYGYGPHSFPGFSGAADASGPLRGDVVVFKHPGRPEVDLVNRVAGLPGDRIRLRNGILLVNGQEAEQQPVTQQADNLNGMPLENRVREILPDGTGYEVYIGRRSAPLNNTREYLVPDGHYFLLGDNRANSLDSRFDIIGYVPGESIYAKLGWIFLRPGANGN